MEAILSGIVQFLASLFNAGDLSAPALPVKTYTAQSIKNLTYGAPPVGISPELAFTLFALEIGIEDFNWKPGPTFLETLSLSNRHKGSGRGYWTGKIKLLIPPLGRAPEDLRVYESVEQSLQDFAQLMGDPLYKQAADAGRRADRRGFFEGVSNAGYAGPDYKDRLENRFQTLRARGVI